MARLPPTKTFESGHLPVAGRQSVYYEQVGPPDCQPVLFVHGEPYSNCCPAYRQLLDPTPWYAVLLDPRGFDRYEPLASVADSTIWHLLEHIEALHVHLGIARWLMSGGFSRSALGVAHPDAHCDACAGLVLRDVLLTRPKDLSWRHFGSAIFFLKVWEEPPDHIPEYEHRDLASAKNRWLLEPGPVVRTPSAHAVRRHGPSRGALLPDPSDPSADQRALTKARIHWLFKTKGAFLGEKQLLKQIDCIRCLLALIVPGRYDEICPAQTAHALRNAWPKPNNVAIADAGHKVREPGTEDALTAALGRFREAA